MVKLSDTEVSTALNQLPGWALEKGELIREWKFADFVEAMSFVNQVAALAEEKGHHPDIDIRYNRVRLALMTHDVGGITENDTAMAASLSELL